MRLIWLVAAALGGLSASAAGGPAATDFAACPQVLKPYEARYVSSYNGLRLAGLRSLSHGAAGDLVLAHQVESVGGQIREQSVLETSPSGLRVRQYEMVRSVLGVRREDHASFDWASGLIQTRGRRQAQLLLDREYFDPLSYQLALRCDVALGRQAMSYALVRHGKARRYDFRRLGIEMVDTPLGRVEAVGVERVRDTDERTTRIWFAPALNYLLVKLRQEEKEDALDLTLQLEAVESR